MSSLVNEFIAIGQTIADIREIRPDATGEYLTVVVDAHDGEYRIPLDRVARSLATATPDERAGAIRQQLAVAVESCRDKASGRSWDTARLLLLRTMLMPASAQARYPDSIVGVEVLPGIAETAVLDRPTSIANVCQDELTRWQVDVEEVLTAGRDNLDHAPDPAQWRKFTGQPLWTLEGADDYSTARVVRPGWLRKHSPPGAGRVVFAMPTRTTVVAGRLPELKAGLAQFAETTQKAWRQGLNQVSPVLYVLNGDEISPLRVKAGKAAEVLRRGELSLAATEYHQQVEHASTKAGDQWASLQVMELDGRHASLTSWTGSTLNDLLPRADFVAVAEDATTMAVVPWVDFARITSEFVRHEPGMMPGRWRTVAPLTTQARAELGERAVRRASQP